MDGAYFCFTSLMTIGFGDFVPGNNYIYNTHHIPGGHVAHAKLVLGAVYLLLGMAIIGMCLNLVQEKIFTQVSFICMFTNSKRKTQETFAFKTNLSFQVRLLARTMGFLKDYEDVDDI